MTTGNADEQRIFAGALQCSDEAALSAYLNQYCGEDSRLRARVQSLLHAAAAAGDFLEPGAPGAEMLITPETEICEGPGTQIGPYRLLELIGEGGCGLVFMAEQQEPIRRTVALKILKPGMDTRAVVARFESERQALALMDHPYIARIFDGGATPGGRPYFVMELVRGVPVTEYCDAARLDTGARLALFSQICEAVHHAHSRGIIHRDLKPSNILVTVNDGVAVPRIIDFGIAKSTRMPLTARSLFTRFHAFIGTPAYTSPEQAEMSSVEVDSRSDVYSLGVLLYELLTGRTPFDSGELWSAGLDEMRRIIRDDLPERPSHRVSSLGAAEVTELSLKRGVQVPSLASSLRGDLDWIVMKCIEKNRGRRYQSAADLALDIDRHLNHQPVHARAPGLLYKLGKFIRRRRHALIAGGAVAAAVLAGAWISWKQSVRASEGEGRAESALAHLQATAPVHAAQARALTKLGDFAQADAAVAEGLKLLPDDPVLLAEKARIRECLGQYPAAATAYRQALAGNPLLPGIATHLEFCSRLGDERTPEWYATLGKLAVIMHDEMWSDPEMAYAAAVLRDEGVRRLESEQGLRGYEPSSMISIAPGGIIQLLARGIPLTNLQSLKDLPFTLVDVSYSEVTDIAPLTTMAVMSLNLTGTKVVDFRPLPILGRLKQLTLAETRFTDTGLLQGLKLSWLSLSGTPVTSLSGLRGLPLNVLRVRGTRVDSLQPLEGSALTELDLAEVPVTDFTALSKCPKLAHLSLSRTKISSLEPLRTLRLITLVMDQTPVGDLKPLENMPLQYLLFHNTPVLDLSPLTRIPTLQHITLPRWALNVPVLRAMPRLSRISYSLNPAGSPSLTAEQFWSRRGLPLPSQ